MSNTIGSTGSNFVIWDGSIAANRVGTKEETKLAHKPQEKLQVVGNIDAFVPRLPGVSRTVFKDSNNELYVRTAVYTVPGHKRPVYSWFDEGQATQPAVTASKN